MVVTSFKLLNKIAISFILKELKRSGHKLLNVNFSHILLLYIRGR